jgi:voltage-gated potassium channel
MAKCNLWYPQTLKVFTILVIIAGAISVAYTVSGFVQLIAEGEIRRALNLKRMTQDIESLENHVIICGFGRIGQMVARKLKDEHHQAFVVIDNDSGTECPGSRTGFFDVPGQCNG